MRADHPLRDIPHRLSLALADLCRQGTIGAVLGLAVPGRAPLLLAAGHADIARTQAVTPGYQFCIGSQSKSFTAVTALSLIKAGLLDLDRPVADYAADLRHGGEVTMRQLLTHQSGLGNGHALLTPPKRLPDREVGFDELETLSLADGRHFAAGERFEYNNYGYALAAHVMARATGTPYESLLRDRVLAPLGLNQTRLGRRRADLPPGLMASGWYRPDPTLDFADMADGGDLFWAGSSGAMVSDLGDLLHWYQCLRDGSAGGIGLADCLATQVADPHQGMRTAYALGLECRMFGGIPCWGHGGRVLGYLSAGFVEPESGITLALLTNLAETGVADLTATMMLIQSVASLALHAGLDMVE
ncbi:MAG: serine hydrolase domain-containing protein [Niveispirillum sp.]|uniref:serine hydrolase domain-containing protein n=1 Tax=Niveispirillum sp. TaxID=1917217 RepID=UPI0026D1509C